MQSCATLEKRLDQAFDWINKLLSENQKAVEEQVAIVESARGTKQYRSLWTGRNKIAEDFETKLNHLYIRQHYLEEIFRLLQWLHFGDKEGTPPNFYHLGMLYHMGRNI